MSIGTLLAALVYAERYIGHVGPRVVGRGRTPVSRLYTERRRYERRVRLCWKIQSVIIAKYDNLTCTKE